MLRDAPPKGPKLQGRHDAVIFTLHAQHKEAIKEAKGGRNSCERVAKKSWMKCQANYFHIQSRQILLLRLPWEALRSLFFYPPPAITISLCKTCADS
jgi:hypothetical protein